MDLFADVVGDDEGGDGDHGQDQQDEQGDGDGSGSHVGLRHGPGLRLGCGTDGGVRHSTVSSGGVVVVVGGIVTVVGGKVATGPGRVPVVGVGAGDVVTGAPVGLVGAPATASRPEVGPVPAAVDGTVGAPVVCGNVVAVVLVSPAGAVTVVGTTRAASPETRVAVRVADNTPAASPIPTRLVIISVRPTPGNHFPAWRPM